MKVYFITIHGELLEYEKLDLSKCPSMAPAKGCDMLIRDSRGNINSANSFSYFSSVADAVSSFEKKQRQYIAQTESRLAEEKQALEKVMVLLSEEQENEQARIQHEIRMTDDPIYAEWYKAKLLREDIEQNGINED